MENKKAINTAQRTFLVLNRDLRVEASVKLDWCFKLENKKAINTAQRTFLVLNRDLRVEARVNLDWCF
ncbi:MAG: hypothetical protein R2766_09495 [Saprospiraceae bacterium]